MTTERDLNIRLAAAAGIHDGDLPALPQTFLDQLHAVDGTDLHPSVTATAAPRLPRTTGTEPASVIAARQLVDDAHTRPRPRPRGRRPRIVRRPAAVLLAAAAAAATAAVVIPLAVTGSNPTQSPLGHTGAPPASGVNLLLADYSTIPTAASEQRLTEIRAACAWAVAVNVGAAGDQSPGAITEARDAWGLDIVNGERNLGLCLTRRTGPHDDTVQSVAVKPAVTTAVSTGISTDAVTHAQLTRPHQLGYTAAIGRTAPDVTRVDVRLANGQTIAATVRDGWWAAWWPNDDTPGLQATQLAYTTRDGRTLASAFPGAD